MSHDEQKKNIYPTMVQLNMADHVRQRQPELDRIDLEILSPTTATHHIKALILSHHHYCSDVHASTRCVELRQHMTALLRFFPGLAKLKIPNVGMRHLDSTVAVFQDVIRTAKKQLLLVDLSIFTLVDERWFFEKSWYLTRLHFTAIVRWDSDSSRVSSFSAKRFAHLLMECCPNVEEVKLSPNICQYLWHLPVDDPLQSLSIHGEDASANKREWDRWTPLHQRPADTLTIHGLYPNQDDEVLSPPPPPQLLYRVHPKLKSISAANTLTITDLQCLSQPCYSRQLTHLIITRYRDNSTVHCLIPMGLQLVLQNASALKILSVEGYHLSPFLMAPPSTLATSLPQGLVGIDSGVLREHESRSSTDGFYKPWACLGLEQLRVPIRCETVSVHEHQRAFEQLGKLRKLEVLDLSGSSLLLSKKYGIEALRGLTRLHTFFYRKTTFLPSKDGFQWMPSPESQWVSLGKIYISLRPSIDMEKLFLEWVDEVFAQPTSRKRPILDTL